MEPTLEDISLADKYETRLEVLPLTSFGLFNGDKEKGYIELIK
jgi:hypothetical protein